MESGARSCLAQAPLWANPLQDWRIAGGRIKCVKAAANRNVHLLTRQLGQQPGDLKMSMRIGRVGGGKIGDGKGSAGFRIGIMGPLREYRNSLIYGQGLDAGFTSDGQLSLAIPASGVPVELSADSVELRLTVEPHGEQSAVTLAALRPMAKSWHASVARSPRRVWREISHWSRILVAGPTQRARRLKKGRRRRPKLRKERLMQPPANSGF